MGQKAPTDQSSNQTQWGLVNIGGAPAYIRMRDFTGSKKWEKAGNMVGKSEDERLSI